MRIRPAAGAVRALLLALASGLRMPNGVAWHGGSLFAAEISRILRFDGVEILPDGSMLVSDDLGGAIYRIRYRGR